MELIFTGRNGKLSERQRAHIEEKLGKLARYIDQISSMKVEISTEQQNHGEVHRIQVTLVGDHGIIVRADQSAPDLYAATDQVQDILQRQIKRYKEKYWRRTRTRRKTSEPAPELAETVSFAHASVEPASTASVVGDMTDGAGHVVRIKKFAMKPMYTDEAVEQMELLGHTFFVFRDADTEHISVVYRRRDGNYGMIVPDEQIA